MYLLMRQLLVLLQIEEWKTEVIRVYVTHFEKVLRPCKSRLQRRSYCELVDDYQFIIK